MTNELTDDSAAQLLALLVDYFRAYGDENCHTMTAADLMTDLEQSLPHERVPADGIGHDLRILGIVG